MQGAIDNNIYNNNRKLLSGTILFLFVWGDGGYSISGGLALVPWSWDWALGSSFPMFP